jgi:hypothetical protein
MIRTVPKVLDAEGNVIAENDDLPGLPNANSQIDMTLSEAGVYMLVVTADQTVGITHQELKP